MLQDGLFRASVYYKRDHLPDYQGWVKIVLEHSSAILHLGCLKGVIIFPLFFSLRVRLCCYGYYLSAKILHNIEEVFPSLSFLKKRLKELKEHKLALQY